MFFVLVNSGRTSSRMITVCFDSNIPAAVIPCCVVGSKSGCTLAGMQEAFSKEMLLPESNRALRGRAKTWSCTWCAINNELGIRSCFVIVDGLTINPGAATHDESSSSSSGNSKYKHCWQRLSIFSTKSKILVWNASRIIVVRQRENFNTFHFVSLRK